eukprot:4450025-Pyramimonas_sp.AAC.1
MGGYIEGRDVGNCGAEIHALWHYWLCFGSRRVCASCSLQSLQCQNLDFRLRLGRRVRSSVIDITLTRQRQQQKKERVERATWPRTLVGRGV